MRKLIIMGAGGRDFHNFNVVFRNNPETEVVAFTATQIPGIDGRLTGARVADQIRATAQVFIDELPEQHDPERTSAFGRILDS